MKKIIALAPAVLFALAATVGQAQTTTSGVSSFVASTKSTPGCPMVKLHIIRNDTALTGVVFFADGSGVSSVKGTTDGKKFSYTMTSIEGKGPTGDVVGTISPDGLIMSKEVGTKCGLTARIPAYADVLDRGG